MYAAQEIPQIDTEITQKGHFRMETIYNHFSRTKRTKKKPSMLLRCG